MLYGKPGIVATNLLIFLGAYKMGEVVEIKPDSIVYIYSDDNKIVGIGDTDSGVEFVNANSGWASVYFEGEDSLMVERDNFKQLCIGWLALNYPDVLKIDDEGE